MHVGAGAGAGAGKSADVYITIFGDGNKATHEQKLARRANTFAKGKEDIFTFKGTAVGSISKIKLRHDAAPQSPAWHCESVDVSVMNSKPQQGAHFVVDQWFSEKLEGVFYPGGSGKARPRCPAAPARLCAYSR